ncbi:MAG TPA: prolyl oligopeptidase family serine peptidase, partial [Ramlibacter sp.]|nr:prolyl oligopeptidase family serine peptidase [Ramlibacter sp.]
MAMQFHAKFLVPALLALCLAACGGGGEVAASAKLGAEVGSGAAASDATPGVASVRPGGDAPAVVQLQRYQIDPAKVFVAGISSGGFAAVQMHVAHSSVFKGAAIYAGGVYWCAGTGGAATALANCGGLTLPTGEASYNSMLAASNVYLQG